MVGPFPQREVGVDPGGGGRPAIADALEPYEESGAGRSGASAGGPQPGPRAADLDWRKIYEIPYIWSSHVLLI